MNISKKRMKELLKIMDDFMKRFGGRRLTSINKRETRRIRRMRRRVERGEKEVGDVETIATIRRLE